MKLAEFLGSIHTNLKPMAGRIDKPISVVLTLNEKGEVVSDDPAACRISLELRAPIQRVIEAHLDMDFDED